MRQIVAILRGVEADEVLPIVEVLIDRGVHQIEVPLNSPQAFVSIEKAVSRFGAEAVIGAGTVLNVDEVARLNDLGAALVVSPNCDEAVIRATKKAGMTSLPGVMTPTECFQALAAGADGLKLFPGSLIGPDGMKAIRAVLPPQTKLWAVGGAGADNLSKWITAGAWGFGIGTALYQPGDTAKDVGQKAQVLVEAYDACAPDVE